MVKKGSTWCAENLELSIGVSSLGEDVDVELGGFDPFSKLPSHIGSVRDFSLKVPAIREHHLEVVDVELVIEWENVGVVGFLEIVHSMEEVAIGVDGNVVNEELTHTEPFG